MGGRLRDHWRSLWRREPWWAEVFAALSALGWSAWSLLSSTALDDRPGLALLFYLAPAGVWVWGGLGLAAVQIAALAGDHARARWWACLAATWWWSFLVLAIYARDPHAPSLALYLTALMANALSVVRVGRGAGDGR